MNNFFEDGEIVFAARSPGAGWIRLDGSTVYLKNKKIVKKLTSTYWNTQTSNFTTGINTVAYGNGLWVAGGSSGVSGLGILTSPDAVTWTTRFSFFGSSTIASVAYDNSLLWAAVGAGGTIRYAVDPLVGWNTATSNTTNALNSVAFSGQGVAVAVGNSGTIRTTTSISTWNTQTSNFGTTNINAVAYGNGVWVAGGLSGTLRTSTDGGVTWNTQTSQFGTNSILSIAFNNGVWVAAGGSGAIRTSTDAVNWNTRISNFGSSTILSVAYGNGTWVAAGNAETIRTSTDTVNWNTQGTSLGTTAIRSVAFGNGVWVAVGDSGILRTSGTETITLPDITPIGARNSVSGWMKT